MCGGAISGKLQDCPWVGIFNTHAFDLSGKTLLYRGWYLTFINCPVVGNLTLASLKMSNSPRVAPATWSLALIGAYSKMDPSTKCRNIYGNHYQRVQHSRERKDEDLNGIIIKIKAATVTGEGCCSLSPNKSSASHPGLVSVGFIAFSCTSPRF